MPPTPPPSPPARPASLVNEEIRRLIRRARGRSLAGAERLAYEALLAEWSVATRPGRATVREDVTRAA